MLSASVKPKWSGGLARTRMVGAVHFCEFHRRPRPRQQQCPIHRSPTRFDPMPSVCVRPKWSGRLAKTRMVGAVHFGEFLPRPRPRQQQCPTHRSPTRFDPIANCLRVRIPHRIHILPRRWRRMHRDPPRMQAVPRVQRAVRMGFCRLSSRRPHWRRSLPRVWSRCAVGGAWPSVGGRMGGRLSRLVLPLPGGEEPRDDLCPGPTRVLSR